MGFSGMLVGPAALNVAGLRHDGVLAALGLL